MKADRATLTEGALTVLSTIAPEVEPQDIDPARALRHQVDLDSMDWLNFLVGLHERFGVEIAESDYAGLITLNDVLDYVQARLK
ncbi:acyl carrier protein [Rhodoferax sp. PAMC 29310]|jgi:acyl carrier protein|uniref:acyl carrier protein n=1 Tax=Rhodoferax sp. PAMC 29310 TaxID=2822760 RepID=UPI001B33511F|nr:acyl carrier protein [Rhodoferax sp. PAMC 29310]